MDIDKLNYPKAEEPKPVDMTEAHVKKKRIVEILRDINGGGVVYDGKTGSYTLYYHAQDGERIYIRKKDVTNNFTEIEENPKIVPYPSEHTTEKCIRICKRTRKDSFGIVEKDREWVFISILHGVLVNDAKPKDHVEIHTMIGDEVVDTYGYCECL